MAVPISSLTKSPLCPHHFSQSPHVPLLSFPTSLRPLPKGKGHANNATLTLKVQSFDFFQGGGGGFGSDADPPSPSQTAGLAALEDKEEPQCPPGLRHYETMAILRPDMTEDQRLALTHKYEELLVAGGGMYVDVFNRGIIPLAYSIKKKDKEGERNTYLDGIYLLFTYFTKPESMAVLEATLNADDDVIRSSSFKVRKRKY